MNRRLATIFVAAAEILAAGCGSATRSSTAPSTAPSVVETPAVNVQVENAASALGAQGRSAYADIYASLSMNGANNEVVLYVTDTSKAQAMINAAHKAHPDTAGVQVMVKQAAYSAKVENAARDKIYEAQRAHRFKYPVYGIGLSPVGDGIQAAVEAKAAADLEFVKALQNAAGNVHAKIVPGGKGIPEVAIGP
ncbi:hypothetical protein [Actinacidiphila oryziradicis]|uniref:Uncharacterized protein n=1 Tax=Actinacidiphila oryziradicis TaxID=2571141 RepID=A0A4U0R5D7_9ACTN|nr:hypothetical protein [Actinacidiphila oryziradicis]TJZ90119.1 hypothetical protein FCI23_55905 [Actinacidiphila oryziradicis]